MTQVHYRGPLDRVAIPLPNGREVEVAKGQNIDLADHTRTKAEAEHLARSLITEDGPFTAVEDTTSTKKKEG
jgi:hypothetical protein